MASLDVAQYVAGEGRAGELACIPALVLHNNADSGVGNNTNIRYRILRGRDSIHRGNTTGIVDNSNIFHHKRMDIKKLGLVLVAALGHKCRLAQGPDRAWLRREQ